MPDLLDVLEHCQFPADSLALLQAQRLFHGRGHAFKGLHHVSVDWLPPVILITLFSPEHKETINKFAEELSNALPECQSIQIQHRYMLEGPIDIIRGDEIKHLTILENDLKFHINLGKSRNTGLFLDMKNGRRWVQNNSKGKRVLNLFSYTCGFSVAAIAGNARSILNVDMSSPALSVGRENHRLNQHSLKQVKFEKLNILNSFGRLKKRGPFDLLICDPPTLQKGSVDIVRDYPKIMRRLKEFMNPDSTLILCLNAPNLDSKFLIDEMKIHAPQYKFLKEINPPKTFIESEKKGLKVHQFISR